MTDRTTLTSFEARIAAELEQYVAGANDPRPAAEIADAAMRPRGIRARVTSSHRSRRLPFLVLAAAFLIPAAYLASSLNKAPESDYRAVVIRDGAGVLPGISIFAVRPDGAERLLREVPNSILPEGDLLAWGQVSESGWLVLAEARKPWHMVLVDLRDPSSEPWIVSGTNLGAVGPAFGPTGLLAAPGGGGLGPAVVIIDLERRTTHTLVIDGRLIGGGPSIVWNADGSGLVSQLAEGDYKTSSLDGAHDTDGFPPVYRSRGGFGDGGSTLRVCSTGSGCPAGSTGSVELVDLRGSAITIYDQQGSERVLAADFGSGADEYTLLLDGDSGRQVTALHLDHGTTTRLATINRAAEWRHISGPGLPPDSSFATFYVDLGGTQAMVIAPVGGGTPTVHEAHFAGFVAADIADGVAVGPYTNSGSEPIEPSVGYWLPPLDELIADELALNPGERVLASGSGDGVPGDTAAATYQVVVREAGTGTAYIDCFGPAPLTVSAHGRSATNPCLRDYTQGVGFNNLEPGDVIQVETTGEVSWRIAVYSCENCEFP